MRKRKVLVVDDHRVVAEAIQAILESFFRVFVEYSFEGMCNALLGERFDCLVLDVNIGGDWPGTKIVKWVRGLDPWMGVILMTADPSLFYQTEQDPSVICVDKDIGEDSLVREIGDAIARARKPYSLRREHFEILYKHNLFSWINAVRIVGLSADHGTRRIEAVLTGDDIPLSWSLYTSPEEGDMICISSTSGCGRCLFCDSGARPFKRPLTKEEMGGQVILSMEMLPKGPKIVSFGSEGEPLLSLENCCELIENLSRMEFGFKFSIITTGDEDQLAVIRDRKSSLPFTLSWSCHFARQEIRDFYMPGTSGQSIERIIRLLRQIEGQGRPVIIRYMVIRGVNDGKDDINKLIDLVDGKFPVRVVPHQKGRLKDVQPTTSEDVDAVISMLEASGIVCLKGEAITNTNVGRGKNAPKWSA